MSRLAGLALASGGSLALLYLRFARKSLGRAASTSSSSASSSSSGLSARGINAAKPTNSYLPEFLAALGNQYDPQTNPTGTILMAIAENNLTWPITVKPRLTAARPYLTDFAARYGDMRGDDGLRRAICGIMDRHFSSRLSFDPARLTVSAGCGAIIDNLFTCICEPGDAVLIPAPYYPAFDNDLGVRAGVVPVAVPMDMDPPGKGKGAGGYRLTEAALDRALIETQTGSSTSSSPPPSSSSSSLSASSASSASRRVKALLLTSPHNPLGQVVDAETLDMAVGWAEKRGIHLVCDEIYALSIHDPKAPAFASIAEVCHRRRQQQQQQQQKAGKEQGGERCADFLGDKVHLIYGLSKDFGMSGYRVGFLYSENAALNDALGNLSQFCAVSNDTQQALAHVLGDAAFVDSYLRTNRGNLRRQYEAFEAALAECAPSVRYLPSQAGLFCWLDLSAHLDEPSFAAEKRLFQRLVKQGVLITPGVDCHQPKPGFFRCCFPWVPAPQLRVAAQRIEAACRKK